MPCSQNAVIKRQLCRMLPGISCFLGECSIHPASANLSLCGSPFLYPFFFTLPVFADVDDLDDINNLDEHIARSVVIQLFVSDKYFTSWSCQNEILSTLKWRRPFFLVHEADPKHGGKLWAELAADCPATLEASGRFGTLPEAYISADRMGDVRKWERDGWFERASDAPTLKAVLNFADLVLTGRQPIMWHRLPDFQQLTLKAIAEEILRHNHHFAGVESVPLHIPGELLRQTLRSASRIKLYASRSNPGAADLAAALQAQYPDITSTDEPQMLKHGSKDDTPTHLLLYLTHETFVGNLGSEFADEVRFAKATNIPIVMAHENHPEKGGCQFERFFTTTPSDLIQGGLYKQLAIPCYEGKQDRRASLATIAKLGLGFKAKQTTIKHIVKATAMTVLTMERGSIEHSVHGLEQRAERLAHIQVVSQQLSRCGIAPSRIGRIASRKRVDTPQPSVPDNTIQLSDV